MGEPGGWGLSIAQVLRPDDATQKKHPPANVNRAIAGYFGIIHYVFYIAVYFEKEPAALLQACTGFRPSKSQPFDYGLETIDSAEEDGEEGMDLNLY